QNGEGDLPHLMWKLRQSFLELPGNVEEQLVVPWATDQLDADRNAVVLVNGRGERGLAGEAERHRVHPTVQRTGPLTERPRDAAHRRRHEDVMVVEPRRDARDLVPRRLDGGGDR